MYELSHLRAVIVLAEELHFRRAAERLHITQPPLSQKLKQLEETLGVCLIKRTTRTVELTDAGKVFLDGARSILTQIETLNHEAQLAEVGNAGRLSIGYVPSAAYVFLPKVLRRYKEQYPQVDIHLEEQAYVQILGKLKSHAIDVALLRTSTKESSIQSHAAMIESLIIALPKHHRLSRLKQVPIAELHDEKFIAFSIQDSPYFSEKIQGILASHNVQPKIVQYSLLPTILSFVEAGIGVALVPESVSRIRNPNVVYRNIADLRADDGVELTAAWMRDRHSILLTNLVNIIKELAPDPRQLRRK
jgi:DNA-binding transcriptional LysR family regulator